MLNSSVKSASDYKEKKFLITNVLSRMVYFNVVNLDIFTQSILYTQCSYIMKQFLLSTMSLPQALLKSALLLLKCPSANE